MNERIVKLFMESVDSNYIPLPIEDHIPSWTEKFSELIVRECMEQVWYTREDVINGNISEVIKQRMKEHFGVGE